MKKQEEMTYEQASARLEDIVAALEKNEASLEESLALFEEGTHLVAFCSEKLRTAQLKITELEKETQ